MLLPHQELLALLEPKLTPQLAPLAQPRPQSQLITHKRNLLLKKKTKEKAKERGKGKEKVASGNKKDRINGEEVKAAKEAKVKVKDLKIQIPNDSQQINL